MGGSLYGYYSKMVPPSLLYKVPCVVYAQAKIFSVSTELLFAFLNGRFSSVDMRIYIYLFGFLETEIVLWQFLWFI